MKIEKFTKKHISKKALNAHIEKIEARGGKYEVDGMTIQYYFPDNNKKNSPLKNLPISRLDTSFLKSQKKITPKYSMTIVGKTDNEEIVYRSSIGTPTSKDVFKIIGLITNFNKKQIKINKVTSSYSEITSDSKKIGYLNNNDLSIYTKYADFQKIKSMNSINDYL